MGPESFHGNVSRKEHWITKDQMLEKRLCIGLKEWVNNVMSGVRTGGRKKSFGNWIVTGGK